MMDDDSYLTLEREYYLYNVREGNEKPYKYISQVTLIYSSTGVALVFLHIVDIQPFLQLFFSAVMCLLALGVTSLFKSLCNAALDNLRVNNVMLSKIKQMLNSTKSKEISDYSAETRRNMQIPSQRSTSKKLCYLWNSVFVIITLYMIYIIITGLLYFHCEYLFEYLW